MPTLLFLVSAHGFGHASRTGAVLAALRARAGPELTVRVRSGAPERFFTRADPAVQVETPDIDVALIQHNGLDVDLPRSLAVHRAWIRDWDARADAEAEAIRRSGADLVVADVPALACEAAARAGVPSLAVSNFSWDWILAAYAADDPRWEPVVARFGQAYARASRVLCLPFRGGFETCTQVEDVPLVVPRGRGDPDAVRQVLGIGPDETRPVVLVSFGGFGSAGAAGADAEDLRDWLFVGYEARPPGLRADWIRLGTHDPVPHPDVVALASVVIGKTAYGTAAEAIGHGTPFLFLTRPGFRESPVMKAGIEALGAGLEIPRADFAAGRWRPWLEAALRLEATPCATNGADVVARALLAAAAR